VVSRAFVCVCVCATLYPENDVPAELKRNVQLQLE